MGRNCFFLLSYSNPNSFLRVSDFFFWVSQIRGGCVCVCVWQVKLQKSFQKICPHFSILLAFFFSATEWAQLSYFGSDSRLWGQRLGIGGEDQVTFSNCDDGPALIPTLSPPSFPTLSWLPPQEQRREKNSSMTKTSSCLCRLTGGWVFIPSVLFVLLLPYYFPSLTLNKMEGISRILC